MKEAKDIEAILHWAYQDQSVDKMSKKIFKPQGPAGANNNMVINMMQLGCRVDCSSYATNILGAKLADDALTIHDGVLSLPEQFYDRNFEIWDEQKAKLHNGEIKNVNKLFWELHLPSQPKQELSRGYTAAIVITNAKSGLRPDCDEDKIIRGGVKDTKEKRKRGRNYDAELLMKELILSKRAEYKIWHWALNHLAANLHKSLEKFSPQPLSAPITPWLKKQNPKNKQKL